MDKLIEFITAKQIEEELSLIEKGEPRTWGKMFLLLESVDHTGFWRQDSNSFTGWIEKHAIPLHTKPAMLWRILSAGRFVRQLVERLKGKGVVIPAFVDMPDSVSPENVELLSKIARAIPDDALVDFAKRVFFGEIKRSELRGAWETYRPVLMGRTARGRGVAAPVLNRQDKVQLRSLMEADMLNDLMAIGSEWTGVDSPALYKIFVHVDPEGYIRSPNSHLFAAVALVKPQNGPAEYHGICFYSLQTSEIYNEVFAYCDYFWVFSKSLPFDDSERGAGRLLRDPPEEIGILEIVNGSCSVIRPAVKSFLAIKRGDLASALLVRSLGSK